MDVGMVSDWRWLVEYMRGIGFSPAGIALVLMISSMMYRSWRREQTFEDRQNAMHKRIDEELARLSKEHQRCMARMAELEVTNVHLDRWKALCEDSCTNSETIHRKEKRLWNGSN